jgi:hypothetical protein
VSNTRQNAHVLPPDEHVGGLTDQPIFRARDDVGTAARRNGALHSPAQPDKRNCQSPPCARMKVERSNVSPTGLLGAKAFVTERGTHRRKGLRRPLSVRL